MRRKCRERFPHHWLQRKLLVSDPLHASRHVRHASAIMHVVNTNPWWWEKCSRHSWHMCNPQFYVSGKRPMECLIWVPSFSCVMHVFSSMLECVRADSRLGPSQWETSLQSNPISHWLGTYLESALCYEELPLCEIPQCCAILITFSNIFHNPCDIFVWNWFSIMTLSSALWILMAWTSATIMLRLHPYIFRC